MYIIDYNKKYRLLNVADFIFQIYALNLTWYKKNCYNWRIKIL